MLDFRRALLYFQNDEAWLKKLGIAAFFMITGIGSIIVFGWMIEIVRRVSQAEESSLPDWDSPLDYLYSGLKFMAIFLAWLLPQAILLIILLLVFISTVNNPKPENPLGTLPAASSIIGILMMLYSLAAGVLFAPLMGLFADGHPWEELFNPLHTFNRFRDNIPGYLIAFFGGILIVDLLSGIGVLLCGIGAAAGMTLGSTVLGHLIGQAHSGSSVEDVDLEEAILMEELDKLDEGEDSGKPDDPDPDGLDRLDFSNY